VSRVLGREGDRRQARASGKWSLHENLVEVLQNHLPLHPKHDDFVFTTPSGSPIDQANL